MPDPSLVLSSQQSHLLLSSKVKGSRRIGFSSAFDLAVRELSKVVKEVHGWWWSRLSPTVSPMDRPCFHEDILMLMMKVISPSFVTSNAPSSIGGRVVGLDGIDGLPSRRN